jgi:hypothetical protein
LSPKKISVFFDIFFYDRLFGMDRTAFGLQKWSCKCGAGLRSDLYRVLNGRAHGLAHPPDFDSGTKPLTTSMFSDMIPYDLVCHY